MSEKDHITENTSKNTSTTECTFIATKSKPAILVIGDARKNGKYNRILELMEQYENTGFEICGKYWSEIHKFEKEGE